MGNRGPFLPNLEPLLQAGIDPKTGLPLKMSGGKCTLKEDIRKQLRVMDRANAIMRFKWQNIPCNITSQELERLIYLRGQVCFFYDKDLDKYFYAAYALDGGIDAYGRYSYIRPVPFTNGTDDKASKPISDYFAKKKLRVIYDIKDLKEGEDISNVAVILRDYTNHLSQTIIPRSALDEPVLGVMAECIPFMRTSLILGTGVKGIRVQDDDQAQNAYLAGKSMEEGALTGNPFVPLVGSVDFQELTDGQLAKAEEYMLAMQSLDNFRLSTMGIDNAGLFEKKSHILQDEMDVNGGPIGLVLQDGLEIRKHFTELANGIWSLNMSCESVNVNPQETDAYQEEAKFGEETSEVGGEENE